MKVKTSEIREKNISELNEMLLDLKEELFNLRVQKSLGQLENVSRRKVVRRDIARVKTVVTELSSK